MYPVVITVIQQFKEDIVAHGRGNVELYNQQLCMGCASDYNYPRVAAACDSRSHRLQLSRPRTHMYYKSSA
jgi:hypothetical protein